MLEIVQVPPNTLIGFKALPSWEPQLLGSSRAVPSGHSTAVWSGLYPQLSFQSALNYLPNQWDRGCTQASVVRVESRRTMRFVVFRDRRMADVKLSSSEKAVLLAEAMERDLEISIDPKESIMSQLGEQDLCLCLMDAEDYELVIPHEMEESALRIEVLFRFSVNKAFPCLTGSVDGLEVGRGVVEDMDRLGIVLGERVTDNSCEVMRRLLRIE